MEKRAVIAPNETPDLSRAQEKRAQKKTAAEIEEDLIYRVQEAGRRRFEKKRED